VFEYRRHASSVSSWRAAEGSRFVEEQLFFTALARELQERGWRAAERAARLHVSSRIHALTRIPRALAARQSTSVRLLLRHALGFSNGPGGNGVQKQ
jgi:hypothetical protein